jgi:hypothetical protein
VQAVPRSSHVQLAVLLPVLLLSRHEGSLYAAGCVDHWTAHQLKACRELLAEMRGMTAPAEWKA